MELSRVEHVCGESKMSHCPREGIPKESEDGREERTVMEGDRIRPETVEESLEGAPVHQRSWNAEVEVHQCKECHN